MDMSDVILEQINEIIENCIGKDGVLLSQVELEKVADESIVLAAKELNLSIKDFIEKLVIIDEDDSEHEIYDPELFEYLTNYYTENSDEPMLSDEIISHAADFLLKQKTEEK